MLRRTCLVSDRHQKCQFIIRSDASTTGMGAILMEAGGHRPIRWLVTPITAYDRARFGSEKGDPAFMAEWELLAILVALATWGKEFLSGQRTKFLLQMDSKAALSSALKLSSHAATVNMIAAEITLRLEQLGIEALSGEHFRGTLNIEADALSRLSEGKPFPRALLGVSESRVPSRKELYQLLPVKASN